MTTAVACPACQQNLLVPPEQLGQDVRCPGCEHVFTATDMAVRSAAPPAAPATAPATVPPAVPPPLPAGVPEWEKPPEEDLERPLDADELAALGADAEEAEQRRRKREEKKARKLDTSKTGYDNDV